MKMTIGAGLLTALLWSASPADDNNPDTFKLPDRAQAYATDDAALRHARQEQDQARADVVKARQQVVTQSLTSPQYKEAVALVDSTNDKYQTLKRRIEGELTRTDPQYQALLKDRGAVDQELAAARRDPATPYATYQDLYAKKEKVGNAIRDMEDAAMDKAGGATARADWVAACKALDDVKKVQRAQVESAPQVAAAKEKAAQTQQSVDQLATKLAGSQAAYEEASYQQGKQDDYNYHHQGDSLDYWDNMGWYGYRNVNIYRGPRVWPRR
jgi:chromosome segregation ATPase